MTIVKSDTFTTNSKENNSLVVSILSHIQFDSGQKPSPSTDKL